MKKKIFSILLAGSMLVSLAGCSGNSGSAKGTVPAAEPTTTPEMSAAAPATIAAGAGSVEPEAVTDGEPDAKSSGIAADEAAGNTGNGLVVYFSWSGNTENVALEIVNQTGADVFKLEPQEPYTTDYDELLDVAQEEQGNDTRPAIAGTIGDLDSYDVIYLGFPNWWGDMPMILYTFLDEYDLSGKTIAPFVTSGGSGFSGALGTIESMEPEAEILDGLSLGSSAAADPADEVGDWLAAIGLAD